MKTPEQAQEILQMGADKISINSPALSNPELITQLCEQFGQQCVVVGIDSYFDPDSGQYQVYQFTGDDKKTQKTQWLTLDWIKHVQQLGAGEIVLNCMNRDGVKEGYDLGQLKLARSVCTIPLIASGGAGTMAHFDQVFSETDVDGALAASVFHKGIFTIPDLKRYLKDRQLEIRI
ncbi:MAG: cyclase [Alteromonadaceae bacterium]